MAAPVFPDDYGGDRTLTRDADKADLSSTVGDLAALGLRMIHALKDGVDLTEAKARELNSVAEGLRQQKANADAAKIREKNTRVLRPLTRLPADGWGPTTDVTRIRLNHITPFDGKKEDPVEVTRWLSRVFAVARVHTLTFDAAKQLLIQASDSLAADYIEQINDEGKTLPEMVQLLEMRYGALCSKEEARVKCNSMPRKDGETLSAFMYRLKHMARIACRYEDDETVRRTQVESLVVSNIRRVLPTSVRFALEERILSRHRSGLPDFTADELELECTTLEQKRLERRQDIKAHTVPSKKDRAARYVNAITEYPEEELSEPELSSPEVSEDEGGDEATIYLAEQVQREVRKFTTRGVKPDMRKAYKGAFKKFNERFQRPTNQRGYKPRNVREIAQYQGQGPRYGQQPPNQGRTPYQQQPRVPQNQGYVPNLRAQQGPPKPMDPGLNDRIKELLVLARCERGQCIQCGMDGHHRGRDECPLKGKPLVDKPCVACGRGLHASDDCVIVYQTNPQRVNQAQEEPLNEL